MLAERREKFEKFEKIIGKIFSKLGPSPNQYTLNSIFFGFFSFLSLVFKNFLLAFIFFLIAAFLDFVDGAVARYTQTATKRGAYLDTVADRLVEGFIYFGFLFLPLKDFILEAKYWIFLAFFGSLMTTYAKAAAKEKELLNQELKIGFFGRGERMILISLAILLAIFNLNWVVYLLFILAIFSNITALQRIFLALK